ncbi:MAG: N-acetylmuramoyl-L-alanine amidase [Candidatus Acidiferrales bacterium]
MNPAFFLAAGRTHRIPISDILGGVRDSVLSFSYIMLVSAGAAALTVGGTARRQLAPTAQQSPLQAVQMPTAAAASLNVVVLDPAHGGTDAGARGASGINESDVVLDFARTIRAALESKGLRVVQTRSGADNPSFDDRSATANAQRGAVFITLHVSSTGTPGQVRVYSEPLPTSAQPLAPGEPPAPMSFPTRNALLSWDRAQEPYAAASRKLAELVQSALTQKFSSSPAAPEFAPVRQLRTVGAPAIAVEVSSVSVSTRDLLSQMAPGLADAIAQAIASFRPIYEAGAH